MVIAKINELLLIKCDPCIKNLCMKRSLNPWVIIAEWFCEVKWIIDQLHKILGLELYEASFKSQDRCYWKWVLFKVPCHLLLNQKYLPCCFLSWWKGALLFLAGLTSGEITDDLRTPLNRYIFFLFHLLSTLPFHNPGSISLFFCLYFL